MIFKIFALFIVACIASSYGEARVGGSVNIDPNDPELLAGLKKVLATVGSTNRVVEVISATKQVVAGLKYGAVFLNEDGNECTASWVDQPWISKTPQYIEFNCP